MSPRHVVVGLLCVLSFAFVAACAAGRGGPAGPVDAARGEKYFKVKCNSCHPNGGQGAGPALLGKTPPGPLKKSSSGGRHNVPEAEWDSLLAFLTPIMQPQAAAAAAAAVPVAPVGGAPVAAPAAAPAVAPAPGMKICNCACQCPVGTPPGQMQNCTCACTCPPG